MPEVLSGSLYDYPAYCDLLFRSNDPADALALESCWENEGNGRISRVLESACGSGRLMIRLARAGFAVEGIDRNAHALAYCNARLRRAGFPPTARAGDIADFSVRRRFDAVVCMLNGFRHLSDDAAARAHLDCVARALAPRGLYVLGLELTPAKTAVPRDSRAMTTRGRLTVISTMLRRSVDVRRRRELRDLQVDVHTPTRWRRVADRLALRTYSLQQLERLIGRQPGLEIVRTMDLDRPSRVPPPVGATTERAVFVLRRTVRA